jgi:hypothetical protein
MEYFCVVYVCDISIISSVVTLYVHTRTSTRMYLRTLVLTQNAEMQIISLNRHTLTHTQSHVGTHTHINTHTARTYARLSPTINHTIALHCSMLTLKHNTPIPAH